jgi:endonuclease/exonuclease/phosphatase family metal-dependent hydrolase
MHVTITTINTWKCEGDYFPRMEAMARQLSALNAGVILAQECFRTADGAVDTLSFLSRALQMKAARAESRFKQRRFQNLLMDSSSGLGILTTCPIRSETILALPSDEKDGGRVAQCVVLEPLPGTLFFIANVHLSHVPGAGALRADQLEVVLRAADASGARYRLIGGDFNADAASDDLRAIRRRAVDAYTRGGGREPRISLVTANRCVDYLFLYPFPDTTLYPTCTHARMVLDQRDPENGLYPSDHFGCSTTLIIE